MRDRWESGDAYEPYVGRWSRRVARDFVSWLDPSPGLAWLDVGCGTGALTQTILETARPASVRGVDASPDFFTFARERVGDPKASFAVEDAQRLSGEGGPFDLTVSGLVLNFVPEPATAVAGMRRVTRRGGDVAAYVWDYAEGMEMIRRFWDAAIALDPAAADLDEGTRFPLCRPEPLRQLWEDAGLGEVELTPIEIDTVFRDFADLWTPFLGGQGPAPSYLMSLDEGRRDALASMMRAGVGEGPIELRARAWAVRGRA